jgi:hypothetical protein
MGGDTSQGEGDDQEEKETMTVFHRSPIYSNKLLGPIHEVSGSMGPDRILKTSFAGFDPHSKCRLG